MLYVSDSTTYLQNCTRPARDVFATGVASSATSVAVVPMFHNGAPFGALYFCPSTPIDFLNIQDVMLVRLPAACPACCSKLWAGRGWQ